MATRGITPAGFVAPTVTDLISDIEADQLATVDPLLDTSSESFVGQNNGIFAEKLAEAWEALAVAYASISREDAEGNQLDNVGSLTGSLRLPPKPSFVFCNVALTAANSPYVAGSLVANVAGQPGVQFSNALDIAVTADGTSSHLFTSLEDGPVLAPSGQLTAISAPVTGWTSVTNPLDATPGNLLELDEDYRLRQEQELSAAGSGTTDAIRADLLEVPGVISARVISNTSMTTDPVTGTPAKAIQAIVWDGVIPGASNDQVAQSLWDDKPAGIPYYGASSGIATDAVGGLQTVQFTRPAQVLVYLAFTVAFTPGLSPSLQTAAIAAVKAAAVAYGSANLKPSVEVLALGLRAAAFGVSGIFNVPALALDVTPAPTATADLTIGTTQVAVLDSSRISVNGF